MIGYVRVELLCHGNLHSYRMKFLTAENTSSLGCFKTAARFFKHFSRFIFAFLPLDSGIPFREDYSHQLQLHHNILTRT